MSLCKKKIHPSEFILQAFLKIRKNQSSLISLVLQCRSDQNSSFPQSAYKTIQRKYNLRLMKTFLDFFAISFLEAETVCFGYLVPVSIQHAQKHTYSSWKGVWKRTIQYIAKLKFLSLDWRFFSPFAQLSVLFLKNVAHYSQSVDHQLQEGFFLCVYMYVYLSRVQIFSPTCKGSL